MSAVDWFWAVAFALLILTAPTLIALVVDSRKLDGDRVWSKPLKFELSLAIHFPTLAWLTGYLPETIQRGALLESTALAAGLSSFFEMAYMAIQGARDDVALQHGIAT